MLHHIGLTRSRVLPAHAAHQSAGLHNVQNRKEWGSDVDRPFLTSRISLRGRPVLGRFQVFLVWGRMTLSVAVDV